MGYTVHRGRKESDTTEFYTFTFFNLMEEAI